MSTFRIGLFLSALAASSVSTAAADGPYLFDLMKKPAYRTAWDDMMKAGNPPQWLQIFRRTGNGVATPSQTARINGTSYELAHVCKPHDCGDNRFQVLFTKGGGRAWGALQEHGKPPRYFGNPSPQQRDALRKALAD